MNNEEGKALARSKELVAKWTDQAEEAIKTTDIAGLKKALDEACAYNKQLSSAFDGLIGLYPQKGSSKLQSEIESESAIAAMRDVALAAVELSTAVIQNRS